MLLVLQLSLHETQNFIFSREHVVVIMTLVPALACWSNEVYDRMPCVWRPGLPLLRCCRRPTLIHEFTPSNFWADDRHFWSSLVTPWHSNIVRMCCSIVTGPRRLVPPPNLQ